jgi:peptidoglycan hydrolase-like protein with peptidoglycan-binding domain
MTVQEAFVSEAQSRIGCPYIFGANGPDSFDCSGLVQWSWEAATGVLLNRVTYGQIRLGQSVSGSASWTSIAGKLAVGDLIFPTSGHVQIYAGNGEIVEAPQTGEDVQQRVEWATEVLAVRRLGHPYFGTLLTARTQPYPYGSGIRDWQTIIGVPADGVFGSSTETATVQFQQFLGVTADGVVGPATWAAAFG